MTKLQDRCGKYQNGTPKGKCGIRFPCMFQKDPRSLPSKKFKMHLQVTPTLYMQFEYCWLCQVLKTQVLCIQNPNLYYWQTMIKTMYLSCFRSAQSWFFVVKLECKTKLFKKQIYYISIDRSLGSINRKSYLTFFKQVFQLIPKEF